MSLLPIPVVHFFPFSEGVTLFRQATLHLSVLNQNAAIIWCILNDGGTPDRVAAALQKKFPLEKDKAAGGNQKGVKYFLDNNLIHKGSIEENHEEIFEDRIVSGPRQGTKDIPAAPDSYQKSFREPNCILKIRSHDKEFGTMVRQPQGLALYFGETDEVNRLIKEHALN